MKIAEEICPDFPEWPRRWMGVPEDSERELDSFDSTCRRLHAFLETSNPEYDP